MQVEASQVPLLDARGRRRASTTMPGYHAGRSPRNKGMRYPADPPTIAEIVALLGAHPDTPCGRRNRAMMVLLWRTGLRIAEALTLTEHDLDERARSVLVRAGKGGKRRLVGMDDWGWDQARPWLLERPDYPIGPLFCVIDGSDRRPGDADRAGPPDLP
jgi:integrase